MPLWIWLLLFGIVFIITYDKRAGRLHDFFGPELIDGDNQRKTQSSSDTNELR